MELWQKIYINPEPAPQGKSLGGEQGTDQKGVWEEPVQMATEHGSVGGDLAAMLRQLSKA